jgi:hypothetical protein
VTTTNGPIDNIGLEANGNILARSPLQRFTASGAPITSSFMGALVSTTKADFSSVQLLSDGGTVAGGSVRSLVGAQRERDPGGAVGRAERPDHRRWHRAAAQLRRSDRELGAERVAVVRALRARTSRWGVRAAGARLAARS